MESHEHITIQSNFISGTGVVSMMDYVISASQCQKTQNFIKSVIAWLNTYDNDCHISEKYFILG